MNLGNKIYELRKKNGLSQEQVAEKVGVTRQTISKWELGETFPDINQAKALSEIFNVSLDLLVGNDETVKSTTEVYNTKKKISGAAVIKIVAIIGAVILVGVLLYLIFFSVFSIVDSSHILYNG